MSNRKTDRLNDFLNLRISTDERLALEELADRRKQSLTTTARELFRVGLKLVKKEQEEKRDVA